MESLKMCDLIDLNSPDRKGLLNAKLASPLIPVPTDNASTNCSNRTNDPRSLITGKRDSLENNPFDMALHKTTEYIQKKDDPFEVTLEKAMRLKCKKSIMLRTSSFDIADDHMHKQKTNRHKLKLNKTLDDPVINNEFSSNKKDGDEVGNNNIIDDLTDTNILSDIVLKTDNIVPIIDIKNVDLSILNQSLMNDALVDTDKELDSDQIKAILQTKETEGVEKDEIDIKQISLVTASLKVPKLRRSFSQGEQLSSKKSQYLNPKLLLNPQWNSCSSSSNISSASSMDFLNEGFLRSRCSESSTFSSLSNVSSIRRINSVASTNSSSLIVSHGTINRTFLESCTSEQSEYSKLNENVDSNKEVNSLLPISKKSTSSVDNASIKSSMSDLTDRLNKLRTKKAESQVVENTTNNKDDAECVPVNEPATIEETNEDCENSNKLIDVDVFTPENCSQENCTNSISDTSSDSVFLEGNKINKTIFKEAKVLARTFEELALRNSSGSSTDDLMASNPLWMSELLPAFDDDASIENLIELPTSPAGNEGKSNAKITECMENKSGTNKEKGPENKVKDQVKELEMELVEPISTEKRPTAATLLLDLKKLVETEHNVEANKLLENLEKALGINCENNTELLVTYLSLPNNLEKGLEKLNNSLTVTENVAEKNTEQKYSSDSKDGTNTNNGNTKKLTDNSKQNDTRSSKTLVPHLKAEKAQEKKDEKIVNNNLPEETSCNGESINVLNGKAVIQLLANIGKLFNEQAEKNPTLDLLKNLGNVLNFDRNNCNGERGAKVDHSNMETEQPLRKSVGKLQSKLHLSKSTSRLSLEVESKQPLASNKFLRRSISVSQTPPLRTESASLMSSSKSTSQLREVTKRFPSDPSFVSPTINKKLSINNQKNQIQKDVQIDPIKAVDLPREKVSTINAVKNRLKKKLSSDVIDKRGPMKAIHTFGNIRKREETSKKIPILVDTVTPPKSHKIVSSTPNSMNNGLTLKKSRSSKPVASSTPDAQTGKIRKVQSEVIISPKKRNFSCDISPVSTRIIINNNGTTKSPRGKLPSPKKTTPKRKPMESGIPKSQTPPVTKRLNSSFDVNQYERILASPQRTMYKTSNSQKSSPITLKMNGNNTQRSPLRDNNKIIHKVKPVNLISKLRRHSIGTNVMEKENNYV